MSNRRILVTSGLPYVNGPIHLGHLVESIQTDIWVRFQNLRGHRCLYFCGEDTHGTTTMVRAQALGISEEELLAKMAAAHRRDFDGFGINLTHYGSTHSDANRALCAEFWASLKAAGHVVARDVERLFDPEKETFLADRFVVGGCPRCRTEGQYGDNCDNCSATYDATDLIDPKSTLSGATPVLRSSRQLFVQIETFHEWLEEYTQRSGAVGKDMANYLAGQFLSEPLRDWDVSRPAPYFGFEIPGEPGHYWYVWFDAPIGYVAATREWCDETGESLDDWWKSDDCEVHHFIGKDIVYFHTLFWPSMLKTAGYSIPKRVHVHGFLTVDGEKMSKRRGTFIEASTYLEYLDPQYLRYYYASKLNGRIDDLDLNLEEFVNKVNSDLVGKVVNLASRTARLAKASGLAEEYPEDGGLFAQAAEAGSEIAEAYEQDDTAHAMRRVMELADRANEYVEQAAPWTLKKEPGREAELQQVCTVALNLFRQLVVYLGPVLPKLTQGCDALLGTPIAHWDDAAKPLLGTPVAKFKHLMQRVDADQLAGMVEASRKE